jgi:uncharacterized protein
MEYLEPSDPDRPSTWKKYRAGLCEGCWAACCTLPVEVTASDLLRLGVVAPDEVQGSLKKVARRLISERVVRSFRAATGLFILDHSPSGECVFLGKDRRCTVYDRRPDVCRRFPEIGPRPGHCPAKKNR